MLFRLHATNETVDFILENAAKDGSDDRTFTMRKTNKWAVIRNCRQKCQQLRVQPIKQVAHKLVCILLLIATATFISQH